MAFLGVYETYFIYGIKVLAYVRIAFARYRRNGAQLRVKPRAAAASDDVVDRFLFRLERLKYELAGFLIVAPERKIDYPRILVVLNERIVRISGYLRRDIHVTAVLRNLQVVKTRHRAVDTLVAACLPGKFGNRRM